MDSHRDYIEFLLRRYPKLSAAKIDELEDSDRSLRRYVQRLKPTINVAQPHYHPLFWTATVVDTYHSLVNQRPCYLRVAPGV